MQASKDCIKLIQASEGFKPNPYLCPAGCPTIGFGNTHYNTGVAVTLQDEPINREDAEYMMLWQLDNEYAPQLDKLLRVTVTQNQYDALLDFVYNCGSQNLRTSTLLRLVNAGDFDGASKEFGKWVHSEGQVLQGLVTRRENERKLFCGEAW